MKGDSTLLIVACVIGSIIIIMRLLQLVSDARGRKNDTRVENTIARLKKDSEKELAEKKRCYEEKARKDIQSVTEANRVSIEKRYAYLQEQFEKDTISKLEQREREVQYREKALDEKEYRINRLTSAYRKMLTETQQNYPWLANLYSDFLFAVDQKLSVHLEEKHPPALKAAENVRLIAKEKKEYVKECKLLQYQLNYYETLFPWLVDFRELSVEDALNYVKSPTVNSDEEDMETLRAYLSPEEYAKLTEAARYQLALDRYKQRSKSNWEIGIEYERYIGYLFEENGYNVVYHGAKMGLQDLGRDLIATKNNETYIIQCKRWSQQKEIHENHIFQLYGSVVSWSIDHLGGTAVGLFYSTTSLSQTAALYADYLGIEFRQVPFGEYPLIKCNIGHDGEKIYHLPFDQQYDNVVITKSKGEFYAFTVQEAMAAGFRRAFRWHGNE